MVSANPINTRLIFESLGSFVNVLSTDPWSMNTFNGQAVDVVAGLVESHCLLPQERLLIQTTFYQEYVSLVFIRLTEQPFRQADLTFTVSSTGSLEVQPSPGSIELLAESKVVQLIQALDDASNGGIAEEVESILTHQSKCFYLLPLQSMAENSRSIDRIVSSHDSSLLATDLCLKLHNLLVDDKINI